ncbi:transglycosylase domain-containing protein [Lichenibacterium ramalinae]|uniref:PBP1A family penicillin-binding protein n=1 Tax=Lichenibacterium ramalinae TaxID=2316527 RepID=A0A4V1RIR0_9HYPH|nr:PBP1A family penicillin-binding protein [Lichenibacterium ramalinae]RYB05103.1 PBP1A family penicillin-binding protein [Lichenibacterium ramalinae]
MLALDAWFDSSVFRGRRGVLRAYGDYAVFMERFGVAGLRRWAVELCCEGLTLGLGGAIVALALAIPAFHLTSEDWLKKQDLAVTFLDRTGADVGRRGILHDDSVPIDQMPPYLIHSVLATEDRRFFDHFGIDVIGTLRAVTVNANASGVVQGGSSLTQQLAKNLFLSNERTIGRKIIEAYLALWLEHHMSKHEILQTYLDRVYMGGGTFGIQAASEFYFGKSVRDVSLAEAAMLAGLFKAPTKYAPHINLPAARARAGDVLSNLVDAGYMTEGQVYPARRNPATPVDRTREVAPDWYLDYAYDEVRRLAEAGKLGSSRVLTVRTALDSAIQARSESVIEDQLREKGPSYHAKQSAMVLMEPDGAVRAIVGGRDYGASQFNRATVAQRQPGSSFKPFVYLAAIETGRFKPTTMVTDSPVCIGTWCVRNYEGEQMGTLPLWAALAHSLNTVAVKLSIAIGNGSPKAGRAKIIDLAHSLGLTTPLDDTVSLPVGADVVTVIDMATAYSAFANGGKRVQPYAAVDIRDGHGDLVYRHDRDGPQPRQVAPAADVATLNTMLARVVTDGTGRAARLDDAVAVGKTGTTNNYRDAWFCGFTGNYVAAVWYGNDDYAPMEKVTGGTLPAATWHDVMQFAQQNVEARLPFGLGPAGQSATVAAAPLAGGTQPAGNNRSTLSPRSAAVVGAIAALVADADRPRLAGDDAFAAGNAAPGTAAATRMP